MEYLKYPLEVAKSVEKQTFYINLRFSRQTLKKAKKDEMAGKKTNMPFMIFDNMSMAEFVLIGEDKVCTKFSIRISDLYNLLDISKYMYSKELESRLLTGNLNQNQNKSMEIEAEKSAAYSLTFQMGRLAGKTPAQVLMEKDGEQRLIAQREYLEQNLSKYPRNQQMISAINQALSLKSKGKLQRNSINNAISESNKTTMQIYPTDGGNIRVNPYVRRNDGKCKCTKASISWTLGDVRSVCIATEEFFAGICTAENGLINYLPAEIDQASRKKNTIRLTAETWNSNMHNVENMIQACIIKWGPTCHDEGAKDYLDAMAAAKNAFTE